MKNNRYLIRLLFIIISTIILSPFLIAAEDGEIATFKDQGFSLSLVRESKPKNEEAGSGTLRLRISTLKLTESTVFSLEHPSRIVIDLTGPIIKKNHSLSIPPGLSFSTIRIGAHPNKVRIVIDVNSDSIPSYQWKTRGNDAVLTIESVIRDESINSSKVATKIPEIMTPTPTVKIAKSEIDIIEPQEADKEDEIEALINRNPKPTPIPTPTPIEVEDEIDTKTIIENENLEANSDKDSQVISIPTHIATGTEATFTPQEQVSKTDLEKDIILLTGPILSSIDFSYTEDANPKPIIKLILGERSQFQHERMNDNNYIIKISGFRLGKKTLTLPQFPPHDFLGFTVISAKEKKEGLEITVGVEDGVRIQAAPNGNEIWISNIADSKPVNALPPSSPRKPSAPPLRGR